MVALQPDLHRQIVRFKRDVTAGRARRLFHHGDSVLHRLPPDFHPGPLTERVVTLIDGRPVTGADFVVVAFQIGGYEPCTVTDFEVPKKYGLRQTIADTLGIGGIMRGIRTVPHLWSICEDMLEVCPEAIMLQYVNPMAINTWAIAEKYPTIRQVGLCHSVQGTAISLRGAETTQTSRAAGASPMRRTLRAQARCAWR